MTSTWGDRSGPAPAEEFWPVVLGRVRERYPDMLFVAETYWDLEWALQQASTTATTSGSLTGSSGRGPSVRAPLGADPAYQRRLVRFLENHDEPRAAGTLSPPVFLARCPEEPLDEDLRRFHT